MKKSKASLGDIATTLGVSISTVSRALKGHPRIGAITRENVLKVARDLGYMSPGMLALEVKKRSKFIGVIIPKINYHLYAMAISGIEKVAETRGMHIIICQSNESQEREQSIVYELMDLGVAGVIVSLASETTDFSHFKALKQSKIPLVFFNRQCDEVETDKVVINNYKAACNATEHLVTIGCKKIAYLGGPEILQINQVRAAGYASTLQKYNLKPYSDFMVYSSFDRENILSSARKLLYAPETPDGVLAYSDQMAIGLMVAAKERGLKIPEDLAIIGFNNEPVDELLEPSLTSVDQPALLMGEESANLIFKQIDYPEEGYIKKVLKSFLVVRNSTNRNKV
ncbi:LacI family transcriptional regulator [Aquimarina sp. ERC-38]|uniref:LacI family DNA-binding transcriptional regulator n=1 Tax=Aquimarina sp. ERC-38 TaxID=2949996 RepID=UPI0022454B7B|nr:LacI family DNA-binding transcriptional regulator [Aquimarina sp. ERC-38]UZO79774.1 LacI family transcriptional regulator [Aquimarina sp. ERC-38]